MKQVEVRSCRPIKHLAVIFTVIALILIIIAVSTANWVDVTLNDKVTTQAWGLWEDCFEIKTSKICVSKDWMSACGAFIIITLIACIGSIPLGIFGICTKNRTWYIIAGVLCVAGVLCNFIALVIYPAKFSEEIQDSSQKTAIGWDFDWTYGIAWGGLFFIVGAAVLFFLKPEEDEIIDRAPSQFYDNRMT